MRNRVPGRTASLALLLVSEVAAMSVWFATTASVAAIRQHWTLTPFHEALLTSSVQAGFVAGTSVSALLRLADRSDLRRLFSASAATAGIANVLIDLCEPTSPAVPLLRFVSGVCMAGVYPVGMKLASTWARGDLELLIGLLVAALTVGSALPNALASAGTPNWRLPVLAAAALASAVLIRFAAVGPAITTAPSLRLSNALDAWRNRPLRLANLSYLGHMWELYAMWAWIGAFMAASLRARYGDVPPVPPALAMFAMVAAGSLGAMGGGWTADRVERTAVTIASMVVSGGCALGIGLVFGQSIGLVMAVRLVCGVSVIADSAQFSATATELSGRGLVVTMLTVQTCLRFLLIMASVQLLSLVLARVVWEHAFSVLAIGLALGVIAMARLRARPEARRLAGGRR